MSEVQTDNVVDLCSQVEARIEEEAAKLAAEQPEQAGSVGGPTDPRFIQQCMANNERGDGVLFSVYHRDNYRFVKNNQLWLRWGGHHWEVDKEDNSHAAVEDVAKTYLTLDGPLAEEIAEARIKKRKAEADAESADGEAKEKAEAELGKLRGQIDRLSNERKAIARRVDRLRTIRGAKNCLEWSHKIGRDSIAILGNEIDQNPWLLPCKNGVIDLKTGRLEPGRPDDYLVKAIETEYHGIDADRQPWVDFMGSIQKDQDVIDCLQRILGYSCTGLTTEQFIAVFLGEGRNGKGILFETLRDVMGDLAWTISPEMILEQKNARSSAGPSPDLISLQGRRIVVASETDQNRRVSGSRVKMLTGGDTITGRAPHDKFDINFKPTHTLFLATNHVPPGLTGDFALLKRLLLIDFPYKFVDNPSGDNERQRDPELLRKLREYRTGILGWLVEGCLLWQQQGIAPPDSIRAGIEQLRYSEDYLDRWIQDRDLDTSDPEHRQPFKEIYKSFTDWYEDEIDDRDKYKISKKRFSGWLEQKGFVKENKGGQAHIYGLCVPWEL